MRELVGPEWTLSSQRRTFDVVGITALTPAILGAGALTSASIVAVDHMSPIFRQTRYGLHMEPFTVNKFQTMPPGTPDTPSQGSSADPRATRLGRLIRRTHLDELPQAINVYRNEMSLVGPRPLIKADVEATMDILSPVEQKDWQWARSVAKPGVFGEFQLTQHASDYEAEIIYSRAHSDIAYAANASFKGDLKIIGRSIVSGFGLDGEKQPRIRGTRGAQMLETVARGFGVTVTESDFNAWQSIFLGARMLDDIIDEDHETDVRLHVKRLIAGEPIGDMSEIEASRFAEMYESLGPAQQKKIAETYRMMPALAGQKRNAANAEEYLFINKNEASLFADILKMDTCEAKAAQRSKFNRWLDGFSNSGYAVDGVLDLRKDYYDGNVSFPPTLSSRAWLLTQGLPEIARAFKMTPVRAYRRVAAAAIRTLLF